MAGSESFHAAQPVNSVMREEPLLSISFFVAHVILPVRVPAAQPADN
jgi:hypothetical protein